LKQEETKICPYCGEEIKAIAIKCKHCGSMLTDSGVPTGDITPETQVKLALANKYEIIEEIGRGGMASVYKAIQKNLNRTVALKVIHQNLIHDKEFLERFHREAQVSASLNHPNLVTIFDEGQERGVHYMAMEYLDGQDLHRMIREKGRLEVEETIKIIPPIAEALDYAHTKGLIHRDIKSSNIIVTKEGRPVLTDFGIAHAATGTKLTQTGTVIGTPEYMSPEQAEGKEVDGRSDLYSLGVVMYECLTGNLPFKGDNPMTTIYKILNDQLTPPTKVNSSIPGWLSSISTKILSRNIDERFQKGSELSSALRKKEGIKVAQKAPLVKEDDKKTRKLKIKDAIDESNKRSTKTKIEKESKQKIRHYGLISIIIILLMVLGYMLNEKGVFSIGDDRIGGGNWDELTDTKKKTVEILLNVADDLYLQGNLVTPKLVNACEKYQEVLKYHYTNKYARDKINVIGSGIVSIIKQKIQDGQFEEAESKILSALYYFPNNTELNRIQDQVKIDKLVREARELISNDTKRAYSLCESIRELDPNNNEVNIILNDIKANYITKGDQHFNSRQWQSAKTNYERVIEFFGTNDYVQNRIAECNNQIRIVSRVSIPNLIGMLLLNARNQLQGTGLSVGEVSFIVTSAQNRGRVINQNPKSGRVNRGTPINLIVGGKVEL